MKNKYSVQKQTFMLFFVFFANSLSFGQCWSKVSLGSFHTVAIKGDGTLWAWGRNTEGQLGDGTNTNKSQPIQIGSANNWSQIVAGGTHTMAIKNDGTLWAWGYNGGLLGDGTSTDRNIPTQIGIDSNWSKIATGESHTLAIKTTGTLWAWGFTVYGKLGNGTNGNPYNISSPTQVGVDNNWNAIGTGESHTVAIKNDGTLWAWGKNNSGQLGDGTTVNKITPTQVGTATNWAKINVGYVHTMAIKNDGTLWVWGDNSNGQLGNGTNGTAYALHSPTQIGVTNNWLWNEVAAGYGYTMAIKNDNTLQGFGWNGYGQLGIGSNVNKNIPTNVGTFINWERVVAGFNHTVAIKNDGTLWAWGSNAYGQLGDGTLSSKNTPNQVLCTALGIINFDNANFIIYPNPTSHIINIETPQAQLEKVELYDMQGRLIISVIINTNRYQMDISHLEKANYFLRLFSNRGVKNIKVIKD